MSQDDLVALLRSARFTFSSEYDLQSGIEMLLRSKNVVFEREVVLSPKDRIDFMVGDVGIEVKVAGSMSTLLRQLDRYLHDSRVASVIVVTSRSSHVEVPPTLLDKSIKVVYLSGSSF